MTFTVLTSNSTVDNSRCQLKEMYQGTTSGELAKKKLQSTPRTTGCSFYEIEILQY